jgi:hypothetical protein
MEIMIRRSDVKRNVQEEVQKGGLISIVQRFNSIHYRQKPLICQHLTTSGFPPPPQDSKEKNDGFFNIIARRKAPNLSAGSFSFVCLKLKSPDPLLLKMGSNVQKKGGDV